MYRYNYDYQASVEEFLNFKWTLVFNAHTFLGTKSIPNDIPKRLEGTGPKDIYT